MKSSKVRGMAAVAVLTAAAAPVVAGNTVVVTQQPDYGYLRDAGKDAFSGLGQQLGVALGSATRQRKPKSLVLIIKCEHFTEGLLTYDDGSIKTIDLSNVSGNAVDRAELAAYQTALPNLHVVEGGC